MAYTIDQALPLLKNAGITDSAEIVRRWCRSGVIKGAIKPIKRPDGWTIPIDALNALIKDRAPGYYDTKVALQEERLKNEQLRQEIQRLQEEHSLDHTTQVAKDKLLQQGREEYWFSLVKRGMYDDRLTIGKGIIRDACKTRRLASIEIKRLIEYLFRKPESTVSGEIIRYSPFSLNNKGNQIQLKTFDGYIYFGKGWRMKYTTDREDIVLEIVDRMISEKRHVTESARTQ